jgi:alkanesulfonate monooxygenase
VDPAYIRRFAQAHEDGGFDRVLVAWGSTSPDALLVASHAAAATSRIGFMVAHRPGFITPTLAARQFATFDHLSNGRAAIHVISGGSPAEQRKDGDYLSHGERYLRTEEYVSLLKRLWTSDAPFDWEGASYRFEGGFSEVKPLQKPHIPVYFGGSSDVAIDIAGRLADVYAFWGETLDQARETIGRVRESAAKAGRDPASIRFSLSVRPVLAGTEEAAWARADRIIARIGELRADAVGAADPSRRASVPSACWRRRPAAACATSGCGPRSRPPSAPARTRPRWWERRSRWRMRSPTITPSASRPS